MANIKIPKKLIEVALPLDDINAEAIREKSIRHGHPSTLHLWWARRPLAVARAVLFAQLVNDPGYERHLQRGVSKEAAEKERERLFGIMRRLVKWENTNDEEVLREAREEIWKSWRETCELNKGIPGFDPDKLPAFHDPFAGGGTIPLEAQRLGLESYASDLNPVAVMINKAMIEIPPKFAGLPPVNPETKGMLVQTADDWKGTRGLVEDIKYYGQWIRDEAFKRIGHLYPKIDVPEEYGGGKGTVIAWIWARTVKSPNPAYNHVEVPLISSYYLSPKTGREVYIEPVIEGDKYRFTIKKGKPKDSSVKNGTKLARGAHFKCILSGTPITPDYIKNEGVQGRMGTRMIAVVVESSIGRIFLPASDEMEMIAKKAEPSWLPDAEIPGDRRSMFTPLYGLTHFYHLFTPRQLVALTTLSDLVSEVRDKIILDAKLKGIENDGVHLKDGGRGVQAYAEAISIYLSFAVDRTANYCSAQTPWGGDFIVQTFGRQAIPMVWDFAEGNPFSNSTGNFMGAIEWIIKCLQFSIPANGKGISLQADAQTQKISESKIVSTDPPYYDNIGYADLSDFFYLWMRRSLKEILPDLFATVTVPKTEELVALPYRHGSKEKAEQFFMEGMTQAMYNLRNQAHNCFPITIYYAFKQSETRAEGTASTGWATFLEAVIKAGFVITGTWPMRTERDQGLKTGTNVLASSIVLVCRPRPQGAETISRRTFIRELNEALPEALEIMVGGKNGVSPVAAVDLHQAAIGPGMAVYSKYAAVLEADGSPMTVKTALQLINRVVDAFLNSTEGEMDSDSLFCLTWFDQYGWKSGEYGQAEVLATAKGTTVDGMRNVGILEAAHGLVRLFKWQEYSSDWRPDQDNRTPVWEALHHLIRALQQQGEQAAGALLAGMPDRSEAIRNLAYRLYTICERKGWAEDARAYNELIASWDAIDAAANEIGYYGTQTELF
jgi:putative DNA methylase